MVIDSSALVAILQKEPERDHLIARIDADPVRLLSVVSLVETASVIEARFGYEGGRDLDRLVAQSSIEIVPVDEDQGTMAREAYRRFGKGRHPARLNLGDCFAYALAKTTGESLLFKGTDFALTDIVVA